jgi:hypothetical protein
VDRKQYFTIFQEFSEAFAFCEIVACGKMDHHPWICLDLVISEHMTQEILFEETKTGGNNRQTGIENGMCRYGNVQME